LFYISGTSDRHSDDHPSVVGFFRRDSQQSQTQGGGEASSRRNSDLELQHQAGVSESDIERRRQKRSLRSQQRRNTLDDVIPEDEMTNTDEETADADERNITKL
jgi:hypothetical protein